MPRVLPPKGATNVAYGSRKVGPEGLEVSADEAEQLKAAGWTVAKALPKTGRKVSAAESRADND